MAKSKKTATPIDTTAGQAAYALAVPHRALLDPRLPAGTIDTLGTDLQTLGAVLPASPAPAAAAAPVPAPPSLPAAVEKLANQVSAIHAAVAGAKAAPAVRKAYGVGSKALGKEVKPLLAAAEKIVTQATASPSEALALGILPADVTALQQDIADVSTAEASAAAAGATGPTAKEKRAAETRVHEATARIAGAGALAFSQDAATRAKFAALVPKKKG
jgi:hypothetical protein